jgi:hypothetical protein
MKIITHPDNKKHLVEFTAIQDNINAQLGICRIYNGYEVVFNDMLPVAIPSKTKFVAKQDKFCEYNTSNPADWEIFCGYVVPLMVPHFIMMDSKKYTVSYRGEPRIYTW